MAKTYLYFEYLAKGTDLETAIAALCQATSFDEGMARGFLEREFAISAADQDTAETISQTLSAQGVHISYQHNAIPPSVYLREIYARLDKLEGQVQGLTDANVALTQAIEHQPSASDNLVYLSDLFTELSIEMRKDVRRSLLSLFDEDSEETASASEAMPENLENVQDAIEQHVSEKSEEPEKLEEPTELEEPEIAEKPEAATEEAESEPEKAKNPFVDS